jgi:hypothetical protein
LIAAAGAPLPIAVTVVWTITLSALRTPPLMLFGKYAATPSIPYLSNLAMLGYGIADARSAALRCLAVARVRRWTALK